MMKLIKLAKRLFQKSRKHNLSFSEAIAEGIRDTFKEMGYSLPVKDK